ncbi:hypothetical protein SS1G_14248 [Sclerotinia sclerotiorum 1980 UF-70]|uniref:Uncharacterized protein n=1 Tax=Sclerotinia sclerotiorum (strain ATCC 18683 / 1980 / Ss-1) TaxID=665079 RepID=A7F9G7_SCLS1|nr:hypothetical protein SS1G_14248 [Sclerotinia sclerotiorum 1980 UF-70]EDO00378.1 hypothetical protein SS1G_14248 [Sclerotinia sclerotiorum 1980 UF-70]
MSPENVPTPLEHITTMVLSPQQAAPSPLPQAVPLHTSSHRRLRSSISFPKFLVHILFSFRAHTITATYGRCSQFFFYTPSSYSKPRIFEPTLHVQLSNKLCQ